MINFVPPGKLNGNLYGPYYGGAPVMQQIDPAALMQAQADADQRMAQLTLDQRAMELDFQREREAFALSQRDQETQVAMMEQSIQEAMESLLTGEIEEQEEAEETGQINLDFTTSLLDAMQNYGGVVPPGAGQPGTGGPLTPADPTQPNPAMGGGSPMGRPVCTSSPAR